MPASQLNITPDTPMGGNLVPGGATFRTWAPHARGSVHRLAATRREPPGAFPKNPGDLLVKDANGYWSGFVPGLKDGDLYRFYVVGQVKRRLQARSVCARAGVQRIPRLQLHCARSADYPWHDAGFPPAGLQRPDHLPIPHRRLLREGRPGQRHPAASRLQDPGCGGSDRILRRPGRERDHAAALSGVPGREQPGLQRHRPLLARDGLRGAGGRLAAIRGAGEPAAGGERIARR